MPDTITVRGMKTRAQRFLSIQNVEQMAHAFGKDQLRIVSLAAVPEYAEFFIPKKNGDKRLIENPTPQLKKIQRRLNEFLQAVYFPLRTDAAYGFLTNPVDDPSPRHILSNATRHVGCKWLLNVDMQDFFHYISQGEVELLFRREPFGFNEDMSKLLAGLCCYKGRLPMGAPSSPILTNLYCIPLDHALQNLAQEKQWTYTRYADDLSFSSQAEITLQDADVIKTMVEAHQLVLNPKKRRLLGPSDPEKEVTGLLVGETQVGIAPEFLEMLEKAIQHLNDIIDAQYITPSGRNQGSIWVDELEDQVRGKLEFVRQIMGEDHDTYCTLAQKLDQAVEPPEVYGPLTWLEFGYQTPR
jgi:RNA-directed DNA polymerase